MQQCECFAKFIILNGYIKQSTQSYIGSNNPILSVECNINYSSHTFFTLKKMGALLEKLKGEKRR